MFSMLCFERNRKSTMWHHDGTRMIHHQLQPLHLPDRPPPFELTVTDSNSIRSSLMYTTTKGDNARL